MLTMKETLAKYREILAAAKKSKTTVQVMKKLILEDLFFLMSQVLKTPGIENQWTYERCRELQANPDGFIDIWPRGHMKSTIGAALLLQEVLKNPDIRIAIFSHKLDAAEKHLNRISSPLRNNKVLKACFSEILWDKVPQEVTWNNRALVINRRASAIAEPTVSCYAIDSLPTGSHFDILYFDDCVTEKSVTTEEQIAKTVRNFDSAQSLGMPGTKVRIIGTRYHSDDLYSTVIKRDSAILRKYVATHNGEPDGKSVFWEQEELDKVRKRVSDYEFSCQYLADPTAISNIRLDTDWLKEKFWNPKHIHKMNRIILVDPAGKKGARNDYTAMVVIGMSEDGNYRVIDIVRDKLDMEEKKETLFKLHREYRPQKVYYEAFGAQADIEYLKLAMKKELYNFPIVEVRTKIPKEKRIGDNLAALFKAGRIYLPYSCKKPSRWTGEVEDLIQTFIMDEYTKFPFAAHDDLLDVLSFITLTDIVKLKPPIRNTRRSSEPTFAITEYNWRSN